MNLHAARGLACVGAALVLIVGAGVFAAEPITSETGYIQYLPGDLPVVLSVPHGGKLLPKEIPNRPFGKLMRDAGTIELARDMRVAMMRQFGGSPHLVVCQLARVKLDCNRDMKEAAQGDPVAEKAWTEYHAFIRMAEAAVLTSHPHGLYLDIHGHAHDKEWVELGYLITKEELNWPGLRLNKPDVAERSSIRLLASTARVDFTTLVRGSQSLGGLLEQRGISVFPSPARRFEKDDLYFDGGYSTEVHGSLDGAGLDGIQVETPQTIRNSPEGRRQFASIFAEALDIYFLKHYEMNLSKPESALEAE